jgi:protein required for attachment to host cells
MAKTWVVVAESARARIFSVDPESDKWNEVKDIVHPQSREHEVEINTDGPGTAFDSVGPGRHAMSESEGPKEHEARKLCRQLADAIEAGRTKNFFDQLMLVSSPGLLGELRKALSDAAERMVAKELNKNLSRLKAEEIRSRIEAELPG